MPVMLYGKHTRQAVENFPISGRQVPDVVLRFLASIKENSALVNGELGLIPRAAAKCIARSAAEIAAGKHTDQFPVDVFQTGSGTSSNMNMNEVIAALASNKTNIVHPNDHVNMGQSSNDVFPSAVQLACAYAFKHDLLPALARCRRMLDTKARAWKHIPKVGRTHLMDAVSITLGAEFAAYADLLTQAQAQLRTAVTLLSAIPLGGTAVGTGTNAHPKFAASVLRKLRAAWKLPVRAAANRTAAQSCPLALLQAAQTLMSASTALSKIAGDIRLMGSGPVGGFNELFLPELQAGSSIMPGKVNPVLCESVLQAHAYVCGAHATVSTAVHMNSQFELCTAYPVMAHSLVTGIDILTNATRLFSEKCLDGLRPNVAHMKRVLEHSHMTATALAPHIGYDQAALIVKTAQANNESILAAAKRITKLPEQMLKTWLKA